MPLYSAFTSYGQLEYSSEPSDAEKIYDAARAGYIDPKTGTATIDLSEGTYHESKLYARALAIADAKATVRRSGNQENPLKAVEALPHHEAELRLPPRATATIDERRAAVAVRRRRSRGNRYEALYEGLSRILGAALIAIRPIGAHEGTTWPASPATGPGVFVRNDQPAKVVRLLDPVTTLGAPLTVAYENWDTTQPDIQLVKGDVLAVQPENLGLAEKVTIASVAGVGTARTLTATFSKGHDQDASASTGPVPIWWSTLGHMLVVVAHEAALDAELVAQVNEYLERTLKGGTTWSIVEPTTPGASTIGPFTLGVSPLGAVPIESMPIVPLRPPAMGVCLPASGTTGGGTLVTLYGRGFADTTDVKVDGASVAFTVVSDYKLTFTTVSHVPGAVNVQVITASGATTKASAFTFVQAALSVTLLTPDTGPAAGGTAIVVTGTGFYLATDVRIGGFTLGAWSIVDDNTINATSDAAGGPGATVLEVEDSGANIDSLPWTFT